MFAIIIVILAVLILLLVFAHRKPDTFRIERSATIHAPAEKIFLLINDFHNWAEWSPWEKLDPSMKKEFSGASAGVGAVYTWSGNAKAGRGRMEIIQSSVPSLVTIQLDFIKPMKAQHQTEFRLVPMAGATDVIWTMQGVAPFVSKLMQVFISMDRLLGKNFEAGLTQLKGIAENNASP